MRIPGFCSTYEVHRQHGFNKSVATVYANRMRSRKKSFRFKKFEKKEARTEVFNSEKQEEIHKNCFSNFCEFRLI